MSTIVYWHVSAIACVRVCVCVCVCVCTRAHAHTHTHAHTHARTHSADMRARAYNCELLNKLFQQVKTRICHLSNNGNIKKDESGNINYTFKGHKYYLLLYKKILCCHIHIWQQREKIKSIIYFLHWHKQASFY